MTTDRKAPERAVDFPVTTRLMPATQGMLAATRDELRHRINAAEERIAQKYEQTHAEVQQFGSELRERFEDARADAMRVVALCEEQRAQNTIVIEATHGVIQRLDRHTEQLGQLAAEQRSDFAFLNRSVGAVRQENAAEFARMRQEMNDGLDAVRAENAAEFATVRQEMNDGLHAVRAENATEFARVRQEMNDGLHALRGEMNARFDQLVALLTARRDA